MSRRQVLAAGSWIAAALWLAACGAETFAISRPTLPLTGAEGARFTVQHLQTVSEVTGVEVSEQRVYVATDTGLYSYPYAGPVTPRRHTFAAAMAVARAETGALYVLRAPSRERGAQVQRVTDEGAIDVPSAPFPLRDLRVVSGDELYGCGTGGLTRYDAEDRRWVHVGEPLDCFGLSHGEGDAFWVRARQGLLRLDGDVVTEWRAGRALPEGRVRQVVELSSDPRADAGRAGAMQVTAYALVDAPAHGGAVLVRIEGGSAVSYTLPGLTQPVVGLGVRQGAPLLFTASRAMRLRVMSPSAEETPPGLSLHALVDHGSHRARTYRADLTAAAPFSPTRGDGGRSDTPGGAQTPAPVPSGAEPVAAPVVFGEWLPALPDVTGVERVRMAGGAIFLTDTGRGLVELRQGMRRLLPRRLASMRDLQIAARGRQTLVRIPDGTVATFVTAPGAARLRPAVGVPRADALFSEGRDAFIARIVAGGEVVVERLADEGPLRVGSIPASVGVVSVTFGARRQGVSWLGLVVDVEGEAVSRGVAEVHDGEDGLRLYHHSSSDPLLDGEGALLMPDAVSAIDLGESGMAWIATLTGAVRLGNSQAVVFGEARGVRGEVVNDLWVEPGHAGGVWFATPEGLGRWRRPEVMFGTDVAPRMVNESRPLALAGDGDSLFVAGARGLFVRRGADWQRLGGDEVLPREGWLDVELDAQGSVWLAGTDGLHVLRRPSRP